LICHVYVLGRRVSHRNDAGKIEREEFVDPGVEHVRIDHEVLVKRGVNLAWGVVCFSADMGFLGRGLGG